MPINAQCTIPDRKTITLPSIHEMLGCNLDRLDDSDLWLRCEADFVRWGDGDFWAREDQVNMKAKIIFNWLCSR